MDRKVIKMANQIIKDIKTKHKSNLKELDVKQLLDYCAICNLYTDNSKNDIDTDLSSQSNQSSQSSPSISQITFSDEMNEIVDTKIPISNINEIIKLKEFKVRYKIFIKIIYCLIKLNISPFAIKKNNIFIKNFQTIRTNLYKERKKMLVWLKEQLDKYISTYKNFDIDEYFNVSQLFTIKIKIIDCVLEILNKLLNKNITKETETPHKLVSPFFYKKDTDYIEVYG
jgi:hypothetical protein